MSSRAVRYYNMDVVRYILSALVYSNHFFYLTGSSFSGTIQGGVQPAFFALSGFLVYRSFEKSASVKDFLIKRLIRLMPLYWFVVIVFAAGLSLVSDLGVWDYFCSPVFWKYIFANSITLNFLEPVLPGVFLGHEMVSAAVNGSLWTMKVEIFLTFTYPIVDWLIKRFRCNRNLILGFVIFVSIIYTQSMLSMYGITGDRIYEILARQFMGQLYVFYLGVLIYLNLDSLMNHKWEIFAVIVVLAVTNLFLLDNNHILRFALLAVGVIWLSVVGNWGARLAHSDNLSYGIYLCHYPLINLSVFLGLHHIISAPVLFVAIFLIVVLVARFLVPPANRFSHFLLCCVNMKLGKF